MKYSFILDSFVSNLIVYTAYSLIIFTWFYFFYNFGYYINFLLFYFPYGIVVLAFLFFGKKIIFGMLLSQISLYLMLKHYNLDLPLNNFFVMSLCQLGSIPLTLFFLQKFKVTVGVGKNYKLDKTNIFHVSLITFNSTITLGIIFIFYSLFFNIKPNFLTFTIGSLIGALILIISMKLIVNLLSRFKIIT